MLFQGAILLNKMLNLHSEDLMKKPKNSIIRPSTSVAVTRGKVDIA